MDKKNIIESVRDFHRAFNHPISYSPTLNPMKDDEANKNLKNLRIGLIEEELEELKNALNNNDIVEVADAIGDLLYVIVGAGHVYGIPMQAVFDEIHTSNMTKLGEDGKPILNGINSPLNPSIPLGKVIKGPNYNPPNIASIIK